MRRAPSPLRVLFYAVNGLGLGHLTRTIAIARQLRRLCWALGEPLEVAILTSSEGDGLALVHDFPAFKIPSKNIVAGGGLSAARYRKLGKQWVWNAINLFAPDILVVDTFPAGSFHELYDVLDLGSKNVFVCRAIRADVATQPAFQSALRGYDKIVLPEEDGFNDTPLPEHAREKAVGVPPILLRSVEETYERAEARERLGIPLGATALYASTGGGGDKDAEALFEQLVATARALPEIHFTLGAGMLYRGREFPAPNVSWTRRPVLSECFRAFDGAITAGGFNSVWELLHSGVPCLFLPLARGWDDQEARVERCVAAGAGVRLSGLDPEAITAGLAALPRTIPTLAPRNGALAAAEEILGLVFAEERIDDAALLCDPGPLFAAAQQGVGEEKLLKAAAKRWKDEPEHSPDAAEALLSSLLAPQEMH
ncbi:UDP-glucosyltransferase [Armatimonas rosea]|uniref:Putative glycosyltransferase n=1 Tax=Armatimonas rosea TaxID=685828 RepID=A0A7W9W8A3_ARMRO|nr:UDP-glucosyltransferase [Armatimonas rosea]MBB6052548.1 putative glycosyltransferase [Armatimonas rosea]